MTQEEANQKAKEAAEKAIGTPVDYTIYLLRATGQIPTGG